MWTRLSTFFDEPGSLTPEVARRVWLTTLHLHWAEAGPTFRLPLSALRGRRDAAAGPAYLFGRRTEILVPHDDCPVASRLDRRLGAGK